MDTPESRKNDLAAFLVVVLAFVLIFVPSLVEGYYPLVADSFCYSYPLRTAVFNMLRDGHWPLWTHEILSGYPLLSMAQIGVGYPLTWAYLFLPGHWAETLYVLAPYLLTPLFTYAYCREVGRTRMAALLAGLSFAYGGFIFSKYTSNGMLSNAVMWLPLILIALERSRRGSFWKPLVGAAAAYTLAVLTGIGQGFVFAGLLALAYSIFLVLTTPAGNDHQRLSSSSKQRWAPPALMICSILFAAGIAAFQILETLKASQLSIRRDLSFATFGEGSLTLRTVWRSITLTFYAYEAIDVAAFMAPLVILLTVPGVIYFARKSQRDSRVFFWLSVAVVSVVLMLGVNTPLYQLIYHIPVLNRFRVPARHTLEWSFALAILGAYGWDAASSLVTKSFRERKWAFPIAVTLVLLTLGFTVWWSQAVGRPESPFALGYSRLPQSRYLFFKATHTLLLVAGFVMAFRSSPRWRKGLAPAIVMVACLTEPYLLYRSWWAPLHKTTSELSTSTPSIATRYLQQFPPHENRVYTRVNLFQESPRLLEQVDPHNLTMMFGLHNVAGYEPFILERYSRLLGNVGVDSVNPRPGYARDDKIFSPDSRVLDLLNMSFLVSYPNLSTTMVGGGTRQGIEFPAVDLGVDLKPGEQVTLGGFGLTGDALAIVSSLSHAVAVEDGSPVARVRVITATGAEALSLVAGQDTAEWAHERQDVRALIKHPLASVFDSIPGDEGNTYPANRYWTVLPMSSSQWIRRIEIENVSPTASLAIWKAVIHEKGRQLTTPLIRDTELLKSVQDQARWQREVSESGVLILKNVRSRGRAWMVNAVEAVDAEEALHRIRGDDGASFDPFQLGLIETSQNDLPMLDTSLPPGEVKQVAYNPNAIEITTESNGRSFLVISQTNYPGWIATIDGNPAPLYTTDYIAQGVAVPAGRHVVELRYTAPAARNGAIISILSLFVLAGIAVKSKPHKPQITQITQIKS